MKPLSHPSVTAMTVEGILYALADPVRAQILSEIAKAGCAQTCSIFLEMNNKRLPKSTLSQHFKILREAGLIRSERCGVELHNTTRCDEISEQFGDLVGAILASYQKQSQQHKRSKRK